MPGNAGFPLAPRTARLFDLAYAPYRVIKKLQLDETRTAAVLKTALQCEPRPQPPINKKDFCSWRRPQLVLAKHQEAKKKRKNGEMLSQTLSPKQPWKQGRWKRVFVKGPRALARCSVGSIVVHVWNQRMPLNVIASLFSFLSGMKDGQAERC